MRPLLLLLLASCGASSTAATREESAPTPIGARDEPRAAEAGAAAEGPAGAALAQMSDADLTRPEASELLGFSAGSAMTLGTFVLALAAYADPEAADGCYSVERSERDGVQQVVVRADDCVDALAPQRRVSGTLVVETQPSECGTRTALTLRGWRIRDDRPCEPGGPPMGTQGIEGRVVADECGGTMSLDLLLDGGGLRRGVCRPSRDTALQYRLEHGEGAREGRSPIAGTGRVGIADLGRAAVETRGEILRSEECATEAMAGTTRASAGGHVLEVTYDGATDCSDPGRAPYTLDGEPAGTTEHACAAGGAPSAWALPLALLLWLRRARA